MATAIRIERLEPGFYRTRSDAMTGEDARTLADEINDTMNEPDELELEAKEDEDLE